MTCSPKSSRPSRPTTEVNSLVSPRDYKARQTSISATPIPPYERDSNERHNGLLRHYVPKGKAILGYSPQAIKRIYQILNQLPRKILDYRQPAILFEAEVSKRAENLRSNIKVKAAG